MTSATNRCRLIGCVLLSAVALAGLGCSSAGGSAAATTREAPQTATPGAAEIAEAERVVEQIERARIAGDWAEVNRHISAVAFTPAQRTATPSMPFAELARKAGELKSFELLLSVGGADYRDRKTGRRYPRVTVNVSETYSRFGSPVFAEMAMLKEEGQWRLAGVMAAGRR